MLGEMNADDVRTLLGLEPNATCGFVRQTYLAGREIAAGGMAPPFDGRRPAGSALTFMVTPGAPVQLHRIRNDQLYHYYLGDPLEVLLLRGSGERIVLGPDIAGGQQVQLLIPGNTFHTARVAGTRQWFLGASTEWPGVIPADVEMGDTVALALAYPSAADDIRRFPLPAGVAEAHEA
jgi:predicted cupin superfamily sugar epimerase